MKLETQSGGYYCRIGDRRTRLYICPAAAQRAVERNEVYTETEYQAMTRVDTHQTVINHGRARG